MGENWVTPEPRGWGGWREQVWGVGALHRVPRFVLRRWVSGGEAADKLIGGAAGLTR